jgi:RNA polymerase subunit RPABC4/transcription elongation factor Spt4
VGGQLASGLSYSQIIDRQGRVLLVPWKETVGPVAPVTDLDGRVPPELEGKRIDRNIMEEIEAPRVGMEWPKFRSYRNASRFYVLCVNDTIPHGEVWWYAPTQGRVLGYDEDFHQLLGSFGSDGFVPAGQEPGNRFSGELLYLSRLFNFPHAIYLSFPGGVYTAQFARRTIKPLFIPAPGETVTWAGKWKDPKEKESLTVVSTDKSVHVLTEVGSPVFSVPLAFDREQYRLRGVRRLDDHRFSFWYGPPWPPDPRAAATTPCYLLEYSPDGRELTRQAIPQPPRPEPSFGMALLGMATPMTEAATLIGGTRYMRSEARSTGEEWPLLLFMEEWIPLFMPGEERGWGTRSGLVPTYVSLILVSAVVCALVCFVLARRYSFSGAHRAGWALVGLLFGPVGLLLMLSVQQWPARVACHSCRQLRRVDRDRCEYCGATHAQPASDGTEIFEDSSTTATQLALTAH